MYARIKYPHGVDVDAGVLDPDSVIELESGHFVPRIIALPPVGTSGGISSKDKAESSMYIRSAINKNQWDPLVTTRFPNGVSLDTVVESFVEFIATVGCAYPDDPQVAQLAGYNAPDHDVAFVPDNLLTGTYASEITKYVTGSDSGDGRRVGAVLSQRERLGLRTVPSIKRFTLGLPSNKILTFTPDDGISAAAPIVTTALGDSSVHRSFDVDVKSVRAVTRAIRAFKVTTDVKFQCIDEIEHNEDFHTDVVRPFFVMMCAHCPKVASLFFTQYAACDSDADSWNPAAVDTLNMEEMIVTLYTLATMVRPFANHSVGQQIASLQGVGGAGKTMLVQLMQRVWNFATVDVDCRKDDHFWASFFFDESQCFKSGVFPYIGFVVSDRKNDAGGAKVPQPISDRLLGNSGLQSLSVEAKFKNKKQIKLYPFGVWDTGNSPPHEYVKKYLEKELSADSVALLTVAGDREGVGSSSARRFSICTPFTRITDPSLPSCRIRTRYFESLDDLGDTDLIMYLLFAFGANLICRSAGVSNTNTDLHVELLDKWITMNESNVKSAAEEYYEEIVGYAPVKVTVVRPNVGNVSLEASNVVPLAALYAKMKDKVSRPSELACVFTETAKRRTCCQLCGLSFSGTRTAILLKLSEFIDVPGNSEFGRLCTTCPGTDTGTHVWMRTLASPPGYRMIDGGYPSL